MARELTAGSEGQIGAESVSFERVEQAPVLIILID